MSEIHYLSASKTVDLIKTRKLSSEEVVKAYLDRIEEINPVINSVSQKAGRDECLKLAREADEKVSRKEPLGKLHGLPITIKDTLKVKGLHASCANKSLYKESVEDAPLVKRLKDEGAIVIGLTNVPEMLACFETDNLMYGQTKNPYDHSRTPGGSSGGCSATVAAGGSPLSIGSDAGGSIRWPAHCTGIAAIKPTHGKVSGRGGLLGEAPGIFGRVGSYGPMARFVEDVALGMSVIEGPDYGNPNSLHPPLVNGKSQLKNLRIVYFTDDGYSTPTQDIQQTVKEAARSLIGEVSHVEENRPECLKQAFRLLWETVFLGGDKGEGFKAFLQYLGSDITSPMLSAFFRQAEECSFNVTDLRMRLIESDRFRLDMLSFMSHYDIIICPVAATVAKKHGTTFDEIKDFSYTMAHNLTGWPAAVVRCGTSKEGLPIGVQVVGHPWQEETVFAVAKKLEQNFGGWKVPK